MLGNVFVECHASPLSLSSWDFRDAPKRFVIAPRNRPSLAVQAVRCLPKADCNSSYHCRSRFFSSHIVRNGNAGDAVVFNNSISTWEGCMASRGPPRLEVRSQDRSASNGSDIQTILETPRYSGPAATRRPPGTNHPTVPQRSSCRVSSGTVLDPTPCHVLVTDKPRVRGADLLASSFR